MGGEDGGVGTVLGEWNRVWKGRGVKVGLVAPGVDVRGAVEVDEKNGLEGGEKKRERSGCGGHRQRRGCGERRKCGGDGGRGERRQCGGRKGCGQRSRCGEKRKGCFGKDRGFKLLVEKIGNSKRVVEENEKVDDLEGYFTGLKVDQISA